MEPGSAWRADALERALVWLRRLTAERAASRRATAAGIVLLHERFPTAHDHNLLVLAPSATAAAAADAADAELGGAGLTHRLLDATGADADALAPGLEARGYTRADQIVMAFAGERTGGRGPHAVVELDDCERERVASDGWRRELPDGDDDLWGQLGARIRTLPAGLHTTFLAIRAADGRVDARADLLMRDGVAQVEEVVTEPEARNRGMASALVDEAVRRAGVAGAGLTFLVADADDGPVALYTRLGFVELGRTSSFSRVPTA